MSNPSSSSSSSTNTFSTIQSILGLLHERTIPYSAKVSIEFYLNDKTNVCATSCPVCPCSQSQDEVAKTGETVNTDVSQGSITEQDTYQKNGMDILDMDGGILRSFGYENVRSLTLDARKKALVDAIEYGNDPRYVQERLYFIAKVQSIQDPNPFQEDLEWFEDTYNLDSYVES